MYSRRYTYDFSSGNFMHYTETCQGLITKAAKTGNENATQASYRASYRIELAGEAQIIAETLIKLHAVEMAKCMLEIYVTEELENIQLSNNTSHKGNISALITGDWISSSQCKHACWTKKISPR
jgi:hypothetical protein